MWTSKTRTATLGSAGYSYGYDSQNRLATLARSGGSTYSYATDARGNITSDGRQAYEFDERNRLTAVTGKESYLYDGMGRRTYQVRSDSSLSVSQYSQAGQILYRGDIITPENQRTHEYIYLAGSLVTTLDHSWPSNAITATNYQHTDALGSPVAVTDPSKAVTERTQYTPFGAPFNHPVEGIGYTGHVMDQATGLVYAQQRYFDPQLGRFLSVDPMASDTNTAWNFNRYNYANNNPYTFTDPDGRVAKSFSSNACGLTGCGDASFSAGEYSSITGAEFKKETPKEPTKDRRPPLPPPPKGCGVTRSCVFDGTKWKPISNSESQYWARVKQNFKDANMSSPGMLAPPLAGIITGRAVANATSLPTLLDAATGAYRAGYLTLEFAPAAAHFTINFALIGGAYEVGLFGGSLINAAEVPGGGGITYREWYTNEMCRASKDC